ncbi:MAG: terminase small subunit [Ruminococcus flavefaciens]|nr:terminase small subunit [Ruminococcus flavefaciens]
MEEPKINAQRKLVAINYCGVAAGNAEKAVIMAGYSKKYARGHAYKIVARKDVQDYINYLNKRKDSDGISGHIATIEEVQAFWTKLMNDESIKPSVRVKASELLAKAQGQFKEEW